MRRRVAPPVRFRPHRWTVLLSATLSAGVAGCFRAEPRTLVVATTTSLDDSGLLHELVPAFERAHAGVRVHVIAVGTGQALALGRRRDADVLFVHAPADEERFIAAGHGGQRSTVMQNDYIMVGPPADPAGIRGGSDAVAALRRVASRAVEWISRGDSSGTHRMEQQLWRLAGNVPDARVQVVDAGQGMAETLVLTSERRAYTLTDRATYRALQDRLQLAVLVEDQTRLRNVYSVVTVRHAAHPADAIAFAEWLTAPAAQRIIANFGRDRFGSSLFAPVQPTAWEHGTGR